MNLEKHLSMLEADIKHVETNYHRLSGAIDVVKRLIEERDEELMKDMAEIEEEYVDDTPTEEISEDAE